MTPSPALPGPADPRPARRPRQARRAAAGLAGLVLGLAALTACGDGSTSSTGSGDGGGSEDSAAPDGVECTYTQAGQAAKDVELPPSSATDAQQVPAAIDTDQGEIDVVLDGEGAPCTVNSFTSLAEQGYFDDTSCHRLTTTPGLKVLQCGDPTGTGAGGPGYSFPDELSGDETYPAGTLAMANAGPDTNGSQFFIVYGDSQLPPAYTVFGEVGGQGLGVVEEVAAEGVEGGGQDGAPARSVTIQTVSVG